MGIGTGLTIDDFEKLPDALARNHELVDGELIKMSGNTPQHNDLRDLLSELLRQHVRAHALGNMMSEQEFDFNGNAHGPDLSFLRQDKVPLIEPKRRVQPIVPDLAIEIVSWNDNFISLIKKAKRYRQAGTREVWIFDIDDRVALCSNDRQGLMLDEDGVFQSDLLPGFSIRLGDLFDRILT